MTCSSQPNPSKKSMHAHSNASRCHVHFDHNVLLLVAWHSESECLAIGPSCFPTFPFSFLLWICLGILTHTIMESNTPHHHIALLADPHITITTGEDNSGI
eukprot:scpid27020/ scgid25006/ 